PICMGAWVRVMSGRSGPIETEELDQLFAHVVGRGDSATLAVSGGSDSTALMVLFADWLREVGRPAAGFTVLTVDHGLRPESAAEARAVGQQAAARGFRHAVLAWEGAKPRTGVQAAARAARYRLLAAYARREGFPLLL